MTEFKLVSINIHGCQNEIQPAVPRVDIIIRWQKDLIILLDINVINITETLNILLNKHNVRFESIGHCRQFCIKGFWNKTVNSGVYPDSKACQESYKEFIEVVKKLKDKYDE